MNESGQVCTEMAVTRDVTRPRIFDEKGKPRAAMGLIEAGPIFLLQD